MPKDYSTYVGFMKALSDETRIKIFAMLAQGELCACNILEEFNITQPTLSYHMKILCESGLVIGRKDGIWMRYSLNQPNVMLLKSLFEEIHTVLGTESQDIERYCSKC